MKALASWHFLLHFTALPEIQEKMGKVQSQKLHADFGTADKKIPGFSNNVSCEPMGCMLRYSYHNNLGGKSL
jgi:hypothetical protein